MQSAAREGGCHQRHQIVGGVRASKSVAEVEVVLDELGRSRTEDERGGRAQRWGIRRRSSKAREGRRAGTQTSENRNAILYPSSRLRRKGAAMNEIWLRDFRCFHEEQTARLAPLTLLVGENSTGKTSFLAMIRALAHFAYGSRIPDFKEPPYDLGSFDEIAHHRKAKGSRAESFSAGFSSSAVKDNQEPWRFDAAFRREGTAPLPERRRYALGTAWIADALRNDSTALQIAAGTSRGTWMAPLLSPFHASDPDERWLFSDLFVRTALSTAHNRPAEVQFAPVVNR